MQKTFLALAFAILVATPAAATDQTRYEKLWGKNSVLQNDMPKVACVCLDGTNRLGSLVSTLPSITQCYMPSFNTDGSIAFYYVCNDDFAVLPK